ncbi:MAG: DUF1311 domain-containing protein [Acidobacteria bacterium]|nr:DUF1311 domain-containing protein [Acidobacteriota bacterium]
MFVLVAGVVAAVYVGTTAVFAADDPLTLQQEYEAADVELNRVYRQVRRAIPPEQREALRQDERLWIEYKENVCGFQKEIAGGGDPAGEQAYWECLRDMTRERIHYLQAWTGEGVSPGWVGEYADGLGGSLYIRPGPDPASHEFELLVVRGPTAHIGEVRGTIRVVDQVAVFRETEECPEPPDKCCRLTFTFAARRVQVEAEHCEYLRGVRAYFAGKYIKIK